jgi:radical SAM protein with 4Fe4S-binding SPASM domain
LTGLSQINIELTSMCNKITLCKFCGHQDPDIHPDRKDGVMSADLIRKLSMQLDYYGKNLVVQFHRDGDPLAIEPGWALQRFSRNFRSIVTHGESLARWAPDIIDNCEAVTVSIFRGDPDREIQLQSLRQFLAKKGDRLPLVYLKVVGDMTDDDLADYEKLGVPIMRRLLHIASGNAKYAHRLPVMPEHGICLDLLHHPSVAWDGRVYLCNRIDPHDRGLIGNLNEHSLGEIWNGPIRRGWLKLHMQGKRDEVPLCSDCKYWGIPTQ